MSLSLSLCRNVIGASTKAQSLDRCEQSPEVHRTLRKYRNLTSVLVRQHSKNCSISRDDECNSFGNCEPGTYSRVYLLCHDNTIDFSSLEYETECQDCLCCWFFGNCEYDSFLSGVRDLDVFTQAVW
jgi:hypothetical protein